MQKNKRWNSKERCGEKMRIAFMFPGQGAQYTGMGKEIYETEPVAKSIYEQASNILQRDIKSLCFSTEQEELNQTENAQIAISVTSIALATTLKEKGIHPDVELGLSLGEYTSLIDAGYINLEEGLSLLQKRGNLMANLVPNEEYAMLAVIGLDSKCIEDICNTVNAEYEASGNIVCPSNYNYSMQTVISGNRELVEKAGLLLKEAGAKKIVPLKTSGPFHTKKLLTASIELRKDLDKITWQKGKVPVIRNLDGKYYDNIEEIPAILEKHMICPVRFDKQIETMQKQGIDTFIEIGPGKTLSGFVKKELKTDNIYHVENKEDIENLMERIKNNG